MNIDLAYWGHSNINVEQGLVMLQLQPNLNREPVSFDAELIAPLRFREGISALHDIVISDLRYKPRDKTAYQEWKKREQERFREMRRSAYLQAKAEAIHTTVEITRQEEREFRRLLKSYWKARRAYDKHVMKHDPELWRMIMPYDPVITVADDVVFFECFSADESSYGCLTVNREEGFGRAESLQAGTTNVDYSWDLYHHFQQLRSYRETRFQIDPRGFSLKVDGVQDHREEKIDLPESWLRGFLQIQAAMGMPMRRIPLSREAVYALLAWLKRHRSRTSPRAVRFDMLPGEAPILTLEPWEKTIVSHGTRYDGPGGEAVRIWGRRRLLVLSRLLPLADHIDVYLLGTGLPSFWVVRMGEMRLTLGLSGWTANDWTRGSALDLLAPPTSLMPSTIEQTARFLRAERAAKFDRISRHIGYGEGVAASVLNHLALSGQTIFDIAAGVYRWRQVLPMDMDITAMESEDPELAASREILAKGRARVHSRADAPRNQILITGEAEGTASQVLMDRDGRICRADCGCRHHKMFGIRRGPCRHVLALRTLAMHPEEGSFSRGGDWYSRMCKWAYN